MQAPPHVLNVRNISVDPDLHRVLKDGKEIELTPKEFDLLYYLCSNCDKVLTRKSSPMYGDIIMWGDQDCGYPYPKAEKKAGLGRRHTDHNQGGVSA